MPAVYDSSGVRFQYPENWTLLEEAKQSPREITLESPSGAFWALHVYFPPTDPHELAGDALRVMRQEYENVEVEPVHEDIGPVHAYGFDMSFFYLDLLVNCRARAFDFGDATFLLITQAEDRDYDQLEPVFRAITASLLSDR
jgi:hypothetical protein